MREPVWALDVVHFRYPGAPRDAVDGITCDIGPGVTAILGPNGSGKSTLARLLIGVAVPSAGVVRIRGRRASEWARSAMAREVGFVPQREESAFPTRVRELVAMGRYPHLGPWRAPGPVDDAIVSQALESVEAAQFAARTINTLSGGEQQRVRIARALAQHGGAMVLDEPTAGLDVRHEMELLTLLRRLAAEGRTIVLVTHSLLLAARMADQVLLMHEGRLEGAGAPGDILTGTRLSAVYQWPIDVVNDARPGTLGPLIVPRLDAAGHGGS